MRPTQFVRGVESHKLHNLKYNISNVVALLPEHLFVLLFGYIGFYLILNALLTREISRKINIKSLFKEPNGEIKDFYHKAEQTSFVLLGFAIVALTFIMTLFGNNLAKGETIILFFSLAFIFEIIAAFAFHDIYSFNSAAIAQSFQYGGVLAILCGFFSYFNVVMNWSLGIYLVFYGGIFAFVILTFREIKNSADRIATFDFDAEE